MKNKVFVSLASLATRCTARRFLQTWELPGANQVALAQHDIAASNRMG